MSGTRKEIMQVFEGIKRRIAKYAVSDVPSEWLDGVDHDAIYPQECFFRSLHYAKHESRFLVPDVWLVHGRCGLFFGQHAWVELPDGLIFDGVFQQFFRKDDWRHHIHARELYKYTPVAACVIAANMPWLDDGTFMMSWDDVLKLPMAEDAALEITFDKALELLAANDLVYKERTEPLPYKAACSLYQTWCRGQREQEKPLPCDGQAPDYELSELVGSTWHLRCVNGPLVTVRANERVFRLRKCRDAAIRSDKA